MARCRARRYSRGAPRSAPGAPRDRKSTRLNSSHGYISYAVFCLKKKKEHRQDRLQELRLEPLARTAPVPQRAHPETAHHPYVYLPEALLHGLAVARQQSDLWLFY